LKKELRLPFAVLAAVPFVMVLGNSMLIPVFPRLKAAMDISQFQVGLLITAFSVPAALLIPFAGALSDHFGRRIVMVPALVMYGTGGLIAGGAAVLLDDPYGVVLAGRVVQGLGAGGTYQLAMALTGDIFTGSERPKTLGMLEAANGLGKVVSPLLGAAVGLISWFAPFFVYGLLAFPVAAAVWFVVKEPREGRQARGIATYWRDLTAIVRQRGAPLLACYVVGMAALFLLFGVLSFVSDELEQRFGVRGFASGLWLAVPVTAMAATAYGVGVLLQTRLRWLRAGALAGAAAVVAALAAAPFVADRLVPFIVDTAVLGIGVGVVLPCLNMLITSAADQRERGVVTAFYGTVRFLGVAVGPPSFALAAQVSHPFMFWAGAAVGAVVLAIGRWLIDPRVLLPEEGGPQTASEGGGEGEGQGQGPAGVPSPASRRTPEPVPHN